MLEALMFVMEVALPEIEVNVPTLAEKLPLESLATIVEAPLALLAVV
jgi:hypothetical protein